VGQILLVRSVLQAPLTQTMHQFLQALANSAPQDLIVFWDAHRSVAMENADLEASRL
jgi:hypothetical protein